MAGPIPIPNQTEALIAKLEQEISDRRHERNIEVVGAVLSRRLQNRETTIVDNRGRTFKRHRSYNEAEELVRAKLDTLTRDQLAKLFEPAYEEWSEGGSSSQWDYWDETEGFTDGLEAALGYAQQIVEHGIHAFDPRHPRNQPAS